MLLSEGRAGKDIPVQLHSQGFAGCGEKRNIQDSVDLIDIVRKYKFDFENEEINEQYLDEIYNVTFLIIDDWAQSSPHSFQTRLLYSIIEQENTK
jgi:hypothetical protein